jgi:hypothetical protein
MVTLVAPVAVQLRVPGLPGSSKFWVPCAHRGGVATLTLRVGPPPLPLPPPPPEVPVLVPVPLPVVVPPPAPKAPALGVAEGLRPLGLGEALEIASVPLPLDPQAAKARMAPAERPKVIRRAGGREICMSR